MNNFNLTSYQAQSPKIMAFEYFLIRCLEWFVSVKGPEINDISVLKSQKLLFFAVAADSKKTSSKDYLGESTFNNFRAYQYGPVEEEIYEFLRTNDYNLSHLKLSFKDLSPISKGISHNDFLHIADEIKRSNSLDKSIISNIDNAIENLRRKTPHLVSYAPFNLVSLSHKWRCWSINYTKGNKSSIPFNEIKEESQIYSL